MQQYFSFALSAIQKSKLRFFLSMAGIAVGVFLSGVILILSSSFHNKMVQEMKISDERVLTIALGNKTNTFNYRFLPVFSDEDLEVLRRDQRVTDISAMKMLNAQNVYISSGNTKKLFIIESFLMGLLGTIIGVVLCITLSYGLVILIGWDFEMNFHLFWVLPILGIGSALVAGYLASRKTVALDPNAALMKS